MSVYNGEVEIEGNEFSIEFERFIVRDNEYAFQIVGDDEDGEFKTDGIAVLTESGEYKADVSVVYPTYKPKNKEWSGPASIYIELALESPQKNNCKIKGRWHQISTTWKFNGKLSKLKP